MPVRLRISSEFAYELAEEGFEEESSLSEYWNAGTAREFSSRGDNLPARGRLEGGLRIRLVFENPWQDRVAGPGGALLYGDMTREGGPL